MDGYAVCSADLMPGTRLPVTGRTAAGEAPGLLAPGGAHRILTGAPLPGGADAVIAQEHVVRDGDSVTTGATPSPGTNVRRRGEDISAGQALIAAGTVLDWRHVTVLASQGIETVTVRRRPRVALLSSGRELCGAGRALAAGQIHDSNAPMLTALLTSWGADVLALPVVADEPAAMCAALSRAALDSDLVVTTAGISVGDEDHVRDALAALGGDLSVLKVAMKPGKPLAAGRLGQACFIGLPGNPQAALAGAVGFLRPLLARLNGSATPAPVRARACFEARRKPGRSEFVPVRLFQRDSCLWADRAGPDGSGRLAPLLAASGLAFVSDRQADVHHGDILDVHRFGAGAGD
jgi:molybdopterin molybdotransferase